MAIRSKPADAQGALLVHLQVLIWWPALNWTAPQGSYTDRISPTPPADEQSPEKQQLAGQQGHFPSDPQIAQNYRRVVIHCQHCTELYLKYHLRIESYYSLLHEQSQREQTGVGQQGHFTSNRYVQQRSSTDSTPPLSCRWVISRANRDWLDNKATSQVIHSLCRVSVCGDPFDITALKYVWTVIYE